MRRQDTNNDSRMSEKLNNDLRKTLIFFREAVNYKGESDQFIENFISDTNRMMIELASPKYVQ